MRLTLQDLDDARFPIIGGGAPMPAVVRGVSTDTRTINPGDLFVALKSDRADGHDFIDVAIERGAAGILISVDAPPPAKPVGFIIHAADTQVAYGIIARIWRSKFDIPVIGVTGSVGKTTTKEMLAAALSPLGSILKTAASQNNETGVPKALLQLTDEHKAAVVEMGMRGAGQIKYLCNIARPTMGLISLISDNHIELLGSRDAIADAKGELIDALPADGIAFLNADDPYFRRLAGKAKGRVVAFSLENGTADEDELKAVTNEWFMAVALNNEDGRSTIFCVNQCRLIDGQWTSDIIAELRINSPARHDVSNAISAYAVAVTLGVDPADAAAALAAYEPPPMRMEIVQTPWGGTVINDAYNAAPASMKSALETLKAYPGDRKIAFLGDMKELGDVSAEAHAQLGRVIESLGGLDALYTVGELASGIDSGVRRFDNSNEAAQFAADELDIHTGDVVLVKGSRAMKMELVARALTERNTKIG